MGGPVKPWWLHVNSEPRVQCRAFIVVAHVVAWWSGAQSVAARPSRSLQTVAAMAGLGNVQLYAFSCVSTLFFLVLAAVACLQAVRHGRARGGTLRSSALAAVAGFACLRGVNNGMHVIREYVGMEGVWKHLLFVLPLALAFYAFSVIIFLWFRIANVVRRDVRRSVVARFAAANLAVLAMTLVSIICHFAYKGDPDEFRVIGWTNTGLAVVFILGGLAFAAYGARVVLLVHSSGARTTSAGKRRTSSALRRVAALMCVCVACFLLACVILLYEGITLITTGSFVAPDGEYTTTAPLEWLLFIGQSLPQAALVFVLWRSHAGQSTTAGGASHSRSSTGSRGSRTKAGRSGSASSVQVSDASEGEGGTQVPLLGIAAHVSSQWVRQQGPTDVALTVQHSNPAFDGAPTTADRAAVSV